MMMNLYIGLLCLSLTSAKALNETTLIFTSDNFTAAQTSSPRYFERDPSALATLSNDYWYIDGIGAYKVHTRAVAWNKARHTCDEEGGHLAIINSVAEANAIVAILKKSERVTGSDHPRFLFLGFHDLYQEGEFVTIHGQSIERAGYSRWRKSQPDNQKGVEHCGSIEIGSGNFNDVNCRKKFGFICEMPV